MNRVFSGAAALMMSYTAALAGGIERSGQFLGPLFEDGNYLELSFGHVAPSVSGIDRSLGPYPGGASTGNVAPSYNSFGFAYKHQFTENWSAAIIMDQPFGADILYPADGSINLGGTSATVDSTSMTGVVRFAMPENGFGVHAGLRASRTDGDVKLGGAAYGPVNGYHLDVERDTAYGWLAGVSWERPDLAARVSLTYNASIEHDFNVTESGPLVDPDLDPATGANGPIPPMPLLDGRSRMTVRTPKSWNLEFQTGVAQDTIVFGAIRWVDWSSFRVDPDRFVQVTGGGLVDLEDSTTYTLGIGRKFTPNWSGAASVSFEKSGDSLVSPLAPTNGRKGISLAAIYTRDKLKITTGISYVRLGDAKPETGTPDTARADMDDSHAWGAGVKFGYSF